MQLLIDATGGMAGDMFAAALISAGADATLMTDAMYKAAAKIGKASVKTTLAHDGATRLLIEVDHLHSHLSGHQAQHLLAAIFEELDMDPVYRTFGQRALQILIDAEKKAHAENTFLTDHLHHDGDDHHHHGEHDHHHGHVHIDGQTHDHHHQPHSHHHQPQDAYLHEAQDILIDITGAAYGLQLLEAPVEATLLAPVSLGGGKVTFSHGTLDVPAPATKNIVQGFWIPSQLGPLDVELCTPTGASILAALKASKVLGAEGFSTLAQGTSRGGKDFPIPPLKVYLAQ